MLIMIEKGIRGGICHTIHRYAKANNKYMKNYNKNMAMFQKLPVNGVKQEKNVLKFDGDFTKTYDEDSNKGYILELDVEYLKDLHKLHSHLSFLSERMKI